MRNTRCSSHIQNKNSRVSQDVSMGRYLEESIEIHKEIKVLIDYQVKSDGTMELYAYNHEDKLVAYTSKDGQSWESKDTEWLSEFVSSGNSVVQIDGNDKGEYYVLYYDKNFETRIGKLGEDNKVEVIPYEVGEGSTISHIKATENGEIFIGSYSGVTLMKA